MTQRVFRTKRCQNYRCKKAYIPTAGKQKYCSFECRWEIIDRQKPRAWDHAIRYAGIGQLYLEGNSMRKIAKMLKMSIATVHRYIRIHADPAVHQHYVETAARYGYVEGEPIKKFHEMLDQPSTGVR